VKVIGKRHSIEKCICPVKVKVRSLLYSYEQNKVTRLTFHFVLPQMKEQMQIYIQKEVGADI
jgi:hypothetical protein